MKIFSSFPNLRKFPQNIVIYLYENIGLIILIQGTKSNTNEMTRLLRLLSQLITRQGKVDLLILVSPDDRLQVPESVAAALVDEVLLDD